MTSHLFPALLKYWRHRRGLSQLALAVEAEISARHLSFLESGRAQPSKAMVLRLLSVLDVPLRDQNEALRAAGLEPKFPELCLNEIPAEVDRALVQMMAQNEPFPLTVVAADCTIVRANRAAMDVFGAFVSDPAAMPSPLDMFTMIFDQRLMRPFVVDWEGLARGMLSRLHRENLQRGGDARLTTLLDRMFSLPNVPAAWRHPDFETPATPTQIVRLARDELRVGFLVTVTVFSAPQLVALDELRIESCFPLDDETRAVCGRLARIRDPRPNPP